VERVQWFTGCWEGEHPGGGVLEEVWLSPRGGTMLGMNRTVSGERTIDHESILLFEEHGKLIYLVHPFGKTPVQFTAIEVTETKAVFANPRHDYPQRIIYRREGLDRLIARFESPGPDGDRGIDFPMRRVDGPEARG